LRRRFPTLVLALALTLPLVFSSTSSAGTVVAMSLNQMIDRADSIFTGRVVGQRAEWNADRTKIHTFVTLEVEDYLKGGTGSRVTTVRLLGGRVGRYIAHLPGNPQFEVGEDVLLFCAGTQARIPSVLGLSLGKFRITADRSGERYIQRDISTLMRKGYSTASRRPGDPVNRYRLADVTERIAEHQR